MLYYISTRITNTILFSFYLKPYDLFEKDIQTRSFIHFFYFSDQSFTNKSLHLLQKSPPIHSLL